ncbi:terminase large subunit [Falsiroseomonas sp.]|uniref:terminase large subunit n=1 Tax=Falsiroseomonas sp. TaxID=2870721 RepID=UPI002733BF84|nr:terminase TerL endonuclease subunit [Falsiroseomonas sp.]
MRHTAERHMRDLRDGPARGLHWRPELAQRAIDFFPSVLTITAGAKEGEPFNLLPYTMFLTGSLFGWRRAEGTRRFTTCWVETGKGQAKSPWMAAIGLYMMGFSGIPRAEVYAIASDKDQANVLFRDAVAMCRVTMPGHEDGDTLEALKEVIIRGTGDMAWKIEHPESGSKFQSLASGDAISGPRPACVLADEIHEFKSEKPIEMWSAAIAKMPGDPLMLLGTNTPAAGQIVATDYSEYYQRVSKGEFPDDSSLALVARVDTNDDPFADESCWSKALPALGITYPIENVRKEVVKARGMTGKALTVKRLFFGIPVGASEFWIDQDAWEAVQGRVDPEACRGMRCWLAMDLSQKNDLTALAAVWQTPEGKYRAHIWYWTPKDTLLARAQEDKAPYDLWVEDGILTAVPGKVISKDFVVAEVEAQAATNDVAMLAFDQAHMAEFRAEADRRGFETWEYQGPDKPTGSGLCMVRHAQGARGMHSEKQLWMPRSLQTLEDMILNGEIEIDRTGLTSWCAANVHLNEDAAGNRWMDKKRSRGRIDGIVALAMAAGAAKSDFDAAPTGVWAVLC